jgi:hypothetical protein
MKTITVAALVAGLLSTSTDALAVEKKSTYSSKVVSMETLRQKVSDPLQRDRLRRRGSLQASLDNEVGYLMEQLGTVTFSC